MRHTLNPMNTAINKRRVLIVDDDKRIVDLIVNELNRRDMFDVRAFTTGQAARQAIQNSPFDLVIADWIMPDIDGLTLMREAKNACADCVTILMTAFGSPDVRLPELGFVGHYLDKPFLVDELAQLIGNAFPRQVNVPPLKPTVLKVVLGGDANVGKTSLIQRYCTGMFDPKRAMTIGVDFHTYDIRLDNAPVRLVVWDLGGQERFALTRQAFYRGARAVGLIFDVSNRVSFYNLMRWWRESREFLGNTPAVLLANKTDLPRQIGSEEVNAIAGSWKMPCYESSCSTGQGVPEFFEGLARVAWNHNPKKPGNGAE
ncbi:MAG: response regulator [Chloroflexi bacterium]|nr:response regulator [Chloroflexota bacterium]